MDDDENPDLKVTEGKIMPPFAESLVCARPFLGHFTYIVLKFFPTTPPGNTLVPYYIKKES